MKTAFIYSINIPLSLRRRSKSIFNNLNNWSYLCLPEEEAPEGAPALRGGAGHRGLGVEFGMRL